MHNISWIGQVIFAVFLFILFSKRSAHWFCLVLPVTQGHVKMLAISTASRGFAPWPPTRGFAPGPRSGPKAAPPPQLPDVPRYARRRLSSTRHALFLVFCKKPFWSQALLLEKSVDLVQPSTKASRLDTGCIAQISILIYSVTNRI